MELTSYANSDFKIDGIDIYPGTRKYKKLDPTKRAVRYQLGILKADKIVDFKELIPSRPHRLPVVDEEQGKKEDAEDLKKEQEKKDAPVKVVVSEKEKAKVIAKRKEARMAKREKWEAEQEKEATKKKKK